MVVFAYAVSVLFFDVYDMAIDTIFLCFREYGAAFFFLHCFPNWLPVRKKKRPQETLVTDAQLLTMCENSSFQFYFFCKNYPI